MLVGLVIMAELVIVSCRGHIDWHTSSFGPKERRKRQSKSLHFQSESRENLVKINNSWRKEK